MYFQVKVKAHRDHRICPTVTFKYRDKVYLLQPQTTAGILLEMPQTETRSIYCLPQTVCSLLQYGKQITSICNYL